MATIPSRTMKLRTRTIERLRDALLQSGRRASPVVSSAFETLARSGLLTSDERVAVERVDAVAEAMFLVIAADEKLVESELAAMRGAIRGLTGDALSDGVIKVMLETYALRLKSEGRSARIAAVADIVSRDRSEAESAFALACAVALADDDVAVSEDAVVQELGSAIGFDDATKKRILNHLVEDRAEEDS